MIAELGLAALWLAAALAAMQLIGGAIAQSNEDGELAWSAAVVRACVQACVSRIPQHHFARARPVGVPAPLPP